VTLAALDHVIFKDDREGPLGMRVASWLESPEEKGGIFMDANGKPTKVDAAPSEGKTVTIAMIDEPRNPGYPTYWHARGYGLFAANPLGASIFDPKAPKFEFSIDQGKKAEFEYRVILFSGAVGAAAMNKEADAFADATK
jgi:Methane oxygenase PmoA